MTEVNICFRCRENKLFDNDEYFYECIRVSSTLCLMNRKISHLEAIIPRNLHGYIEYTQIEGFRSEINNLISTRKWLESQKNTIDSSPKLLMPDDLPKLSQNNEYCSEISKSSIYLPKDFKKHNETFKDYTIAKNKLDKSLTNAFSVLPISTKRLRGELSKLEKDLPSGCSLVLVNGSTHHWKVKLPGPPNCPYEHYLYEIDIRIPLEYPLKHPSIVFTHDMLHINFFTSGIICRCVISDRYTPAFTICALINKVQSLLMSPYMSCEANHELNACKSANEELYNQKIKDWLKNSRESYRLIPN